MRDPKAGSDFKFLEDITSSISAVNNFFNLGQEFHHFMEVAKELAAGGTDIRVKLPRFFSTTRYILGNLCHYLIICYILGLPIIFTRFTVGLLRTSQPWLKLLLKFRYILSNLIFQII